MPSESCRPMAEGQPAVFLERQMYRRHRLVDWLKILPFVGLGLWLLPLLWVQEGDEATSTASSVVYLFLVWLVLIIMAAVSATFLGLGAKSPDEAASPEDR